MAAPRANTRKELQELEERLSRYREINLTVTGRKTGKKRSRPVWFVYEGGKLYLVPVQGSATEWYKNVLSNPAIQVEARGVSVELRAVAITDEQKVRAVLEKFRKKYGAGDVKKYYSRFDAAVVAEVDNTRSAA